MSYKDLKEFMTDLKRVYAEVYESSALDALEDFARKWDKKEMPQDFQILPG